MKKGLKKLCSIFLSLVLVSSIMPIKGHAESVVSKLGNRGFSAVTDLGVAASDVSLKSAIIAKENGVDVAYTTADGGKFNVVDIKQNKLLFSAQLGDVTQVWTHALAPDGTLYIAGLALNNVGELWIYTPATKTVKKVGAISGNDQVWSSTVDSAGNAYFGTFSSGAKGKVIKYDKATAKFIDYGAVDTACDYVRSIAYYDGYIYAGLGTAAKVYRINAATKVKEEITKTVPQLIGKDITNVKFAYDMAVVNDYLFTRFDNGEENMLLFYDLKNQIWLDKKLGKLKDGSAGDDGTLGFVQVPVYNNKAYVVRNQKIHEIDLLTFEDKTTEIPFLAGWRGGAFIDINDPAFPGASLVTLKRNGIIYAANIGTKATKDIPCVMEAKPLTLHDLGKGPDGKLYMTTYPGGPKGAQFDPKTGKFISYTQGQAEGMAAGTGSDMYFGIYPGAVIQKMNTDTMNIETLFNLKEVYEQDRPYIMKFENDKLYIGTIPDYGKLGGTLTIYDTKTAEKETFRNVVQDQSIVGIACRNGKIYGSTTIFGGLNSTPTTGKGKIFVWDIAGKTKVTEFELNLPELDKPPMISGLTFDKNGLLWGAVDGILFAMNPDTYEVVKRINIYPEIKNRGMWRPVHIIFGEDGLLYTDIGGKLTAVRPDTLEYVTLVGTGAEVDFISLAKDSLGNENIYFLLNGATTLKMIKVVNGGVLVPPPAAAQDINVPVTNSGLEEPLNNGAIPGWSSFSTVSSSVYFEVYKGISSSGSNSLIIVDKLTTNLVYAVSDKIPVIQGLEYTASVQLYLKDGRTSFFMRYFNDANAQVGADVIKLVATGQGMWQTVVLSAKAPAGASYVRLYAGDSNLYTTNGAYFDDFKLTYKAVSPDSLTLSAPASVVAGDEFEITVEYNANNLINDLYAVNALVNYDNQKLYLKSVEKAGSFNYQDSVLSYTDNQGNVQSVATHVYNKVTDTSGQILKLKFIALDNSGETEVTLSNGTTLAKTNGNVEFILGTDKTVKIMINDYSGTLEDVNRDGIVNLIDLVSVAKNVGTAVNVINNKLDVNRDGLIDSKDVIQVVDKILNKI